ncbi:MAG: thiol peroxidase [Elusimicrobia bacterium]|nr:thiol peroxidase [Elusimicrobiota bacterium]MDD7501892.1 thiol peroxidase [Elusimicrobiota bacterium]MDY5728789.1 thiol peroxidase [Elusimicrobiaceae bacterium]
MEPKKITMNGLAVSVVGKALKRGDKAPDFKLVGNALELVQKSDFDGKVLLISCVPSLDTPVCSVETRRFNLEADKLSDDVVVLTVSRDLPFAQTRWCAANGVKNVKTASDYRNFGFAQDYGVLLEDLGLLTRAVFVIDKKGLVQYVEFVPEVTHEPDYKTVLTEVQKGL